ncbi:MAG: FAD:protein FMN transferase [Planctomycetota bacterium]
MPNEKPTSRRDFLKGRAAARALIDKARAAADAASSAVAGSLDAGPPLTNPTQRNEAIRLTATRRAMACEFTVEYHAADGIAATNAALGALRLVEQLEDQLTVYRDQSELLDINVEAAERPVEVEPQLFALIELCQWLHQSTGGAFDMTSGPLSKVWGFHRRQGRLPDQAEIDEALACVGAQYVVLDPTARTVRFLRAGIELNVNSIGKGYALDRAAASMDEEGVTDFLWHGGRSSVLARGRPRDQSIAAWPIGLPHPRQPGKRVGKLLIEDHGLGTAGSGTQFFEVEGRRYGHLLDPRTGWPAGGVYSATAVAASAAEADALATAFYVMGPDGAAEYCAQHNDVAAVLVCPGGGDDQVDVHVFNLDESRWRPSDE